MKRYGILVLCCYLLLMLLPLPALGVLRKDKPADPSPGSAVSSPVSGDSSGSAPSDPEKEQAVFKVLDTAADVIYTFNERDFVLYTVAAEMLPTYHTEALKAQAVATYTYYCYQRTRRRENPDPELKGADFSDVPSTFPAIYSPEGLKERWGDQYDTYLQKVAGAVDAVLGKHMLYDGKDIFAAYHSTSSGTTESAETVWGKDYPYLQPVSSPGDKLSPEYQSDVSFSPEQFAEAMKSKISDLTLEGDAAGWITGAPTLSDSGTVTAITIGGMELTGKQVREALGLRSACFTVEYKDGSFVFAVHGYGHGVGMSQYGADYMARQGAGWEEILNHYYTGVTIV